MTGSLVLPILMRWLHIIAAITAVGGALFLRFILLPSAEQALTIAEHDRLREVLISRWRRVVHMCILAFLLSGFFNYLVITRFDHPEQPLYHALFGVKFLLALFVFALAVALTSRRPWSQALRSRMRLWGGILAAAAIATVMVSSVMKNLPKTGLPDTVVLEHRHSAR
jgi:uncharacterized membrane protein